MKPFKKITIEITLDEADAVVIDMDTQRGNKGRSIIPRVKLIKHFNHLWLCLGENVISAIADLPNSYKSPDGYAKCPRCRQRQDDDDGFGVIYCERCGYCVHASVTEGVCDYCGDAMPVVRY